MKQKFKYLYATLLVLCFNVLTFAQMEGDEEITVLPPETEGARSTPINMYEGLLLVVAVMFIVGMYYYNRRRKLA